MKLYLVGGLFLLTVMYSFLVKERIEDQSHVIAAGRPYCVTVPDGKSYKEASGFFDTTGLLMRGNREKNHAVLFVGYRENYSTYHWSYLGHRFFSGAYNTSFNCLKSKFDYSRLTPADFAEKKKFSADGKVFNIPIVFQPRVHGATIMVVAKIPSFEPTPNLCDKHRCHMIHAGPIDSRTPIYMGREASTQGMSFVNFEDFGLKTAGHELTAVRQKTAGNLLYGTYYSTNARGAPETVIKCLGATEVQCLMQFDESGTRYSLHIMPEEIQAWRKIQTQTVAFISRFHATE